MPITMSTIYRLSLAMTLLASTVVPETDIVINVYTSDIRHRDNKNKCDTTQSVRAVGFSVGRKGRFAPSSTSRIPMDHKFYNKRGYFDMQTTIFTAPLPGVYAFYFGASSLKNKPIHLYLKAGNPEKIIATTYNSNVAYGHASGFVIIEMKKEDQASFWLARGHAINEQNPPSTHFTGFLVSEIGEGVVTTKHC